MLNVSKRASSAHRDGTGGRRKALALVASGLLSGVLLSGCVTDGGTASNSPPPTPPFPVVAPPPPGSTANGALATGSLGDQSVASAGIPIPLISPRHRDAVLVASTDPRAGLSALGGASLPVRQLAGVYLKYDDALTIAEKSKLNTPKEVRRVLKDLRFSQPETMAQGWYAVQGMTAAQTTAFAQGVRDQVLIDGKDKVLASLNNPNYVLRLPGADAATSAVMASISAENQRMLSLRKRLLDTAQAFMRQKWGMNAPAGAAPVQAADAGAPQPASHWSFAQLLSTFSPVSEAEAYSPAIMSKILALGARQVMAEPAIPATERDETSTCLNWARLNLNQCIAAAHFPSEEAWCTGTHAVEEVRSCWAAVLPASATMTPAAH